MSLIAQAKAMSLDDGEKTHSAQGTQDKCGRSGSYFFWHEEQTDPGVTM